MIAMPRWIVLSAAALILAAGVGGTARADVTHDDLMYRIQSAKTGADHDEIAAIYEQRAGADRAAAENHRRMENLYRGIDPTGGGRGSGQMALHCRNIAAGYARAAEEHEALAKLHRQFSSASPLR